MNFWASLLVNCLVNVFGLGCGADIRVIYGGGGVGQNSVVWCGETPGQLHVIRRLVIHVTRS